MGRFPESSPTPIDLPGRDSEAGDIHMLDEIAFFFGHPAGPNGHARVVRARKRLRLGCKPVVAGAMFAGGR
jgi:hypothetical protein